MYSIVIEWPESNLGPVFFWNGYDVPWYARQAIASVGRILIDEAYPRPEYLHDMTVFAPDGSIPLVRDGKPYAIVRIVETSLKRPDAPIWGQVKGRRVHAIAGYVGDGEDAKATAKCGRLLSLAAVQFTPMKDQGETPGLDPNVQVCDDCIAKGAMRSYASANARMRPRQTFETFAPSPSL